ncbi:HypC/HybG/HupF family hydrogenase formation chaperone [Rubinisphaera sp.]|uniref:HypC/HybG/HupF family hydrogenase formation chaperone n=1 Tax=Rubinisphaera sp. TaxID=2024857 RepID=UPI000C0F7EF7|nr:HypC/HybG/HupF family hydrogenase formation chaperone [Rubinisphaera sp.]MBV08740.1 HypC/HybG/HupF family hydrogenase formation chaperone [Rubinisphaera sp.]HCS53675.1 HypC/HybG/HupF family hydrogenase formation chaperone [Planctomycetaceae bacterium]|tara:strand:- start:7925 stop:8185 length:261 start_codon:yes stop_codon:yes gene_type:complete
MCLGIPGRVTRWLDQDPLFAKAEVDFGGLKKVCHFACVPDAEIGDFVIVHAGIAITQISAEQAALIETDLSDFDPANKSQEEGTSG